jgi:hypothetical protein
MRILFAPGVVKEVAAVEVVPMDIGDGKIIGTQVNFTLTPSGDKVEYIYSQSIPIEESGQRAIDFVNGLYEKGFADFTTEPTEVL